MGTEEREISIVDLLYRVLLGWRMLIVWLVVGTVAMGAFGAFRYRRAVADAVSAVEEVDEEADEEEEEELRAALEPEDIEDVMFARDMGKKYRDLYEQQEKYNQDSILMKQDPSAVPTITLEYHIDNHYQVVYPVIVEKDNIDVIRQVYYLAIASDAVYEKIAKALGDDIDPGYYAEVISCGGIDEGLTVQLTHYKKASCQKMADVIKQVVNDTYKQAVKTCGEFDISLVGETYRERIDQNVISTQQSKISQLSSLRDSIDSVSAGLAENELAYFQFLEERDKKQEKSKADSDETEESEEITMPEGSPINVKYILLGAVGGVFLACCWIAFRYIMDARMHTGDDLRYFGKLQNLGMVPIPGKRKSFLFGIDCWLEKLMSGGRETLPYDQSLQLAVSYLESVVAQKQCRKIFITGARWNSDTSKIAASLKEGLEQIGLTVTAMDNIILRADAIKEAAAADGVVLVEELGHTRYDELERELEICQANGLSVLGAVVGEPKLALAK